MSKSVTAKLILHVGSLCFMEAEGMYMFGKPVYYWKFYNSSVYYGPFNSLLETGEHVDAMMKTPAMDAAGQLLNNAKEGIVSTVIPEEAKNVIKIDFKTKRRVK